MFQLLQVLKARGRHVNSSFLRILVNAEQTSHGTNIFKHPVKVGRGHLFFFESFILSYKNHPVYTCLYYINLNTAKQKQYLLTVSSSKAKNSTGGLAPDTLNLDTNVAVRNWEPTNPVPEAAHKTLYH